MLNWNCFYNPEDINIKTFNNEMNKFWLKFGK